MMPEEKKSRAALSLAVTRTQMAFIRADADEVLFGGAAGGGKSYAQLIDALLYALRYAGSRQLILRRTMPELEHSMIHVSLQLYPLSAARYHASAHKWRFRNGSVIEFGYCAAEKDVLRYQGAEYDVVRFDELTHFTEEQYTYLLSRVRGANPYPKQIKSSTNPGGVGHNWVKARFISGLTPNVVQTDAYGTRRLFLPSYVQDNRFLMQADPGYVKRLEKLPEAERRALLYGEWDIFDGQVFTEWRNNAAGYATRRWSHVIDPFDIPRSWRRFRAFDFGYARPFAVSWYAVDPDGRAYNYRELYGCTGTPDQGIRWTAQQIAEKILELEAADQPDRPVVGIADPAVWNQTGSAEGSIAEMMERCGVYFEKGKNSRLAGKMQVHYRLSFDRDGCPGLYVFSTCKNMIRTLPQLKYDPSLPEDVDTRQEDHLYDALKYFLLSNPVTPPEAAPPLEAPYNPLDTAPLRSYGRFLL